MTTTTTRRALTPVHLIYAPRSRRIRGAVSTCGTWGYEQEDGVGTLWRVYHEPTGTESSELFGTLTDAREATAARPRQLLADALTVAAARAASPAVRPAVGEAAATAEGTLRATLALVR